MSLKIVINDCSWGKIDLEKRYLPKNAIVEGYQNTKEDEIIHACKDADAILTEYAPFTAKVLKSFKKCKIISNSAIGFDNIDVKTATELGIAVANVPDYCTNEVADHTMALILSSNRNIVRYDRAIQNKIWDIKCVPIMKRLEGLILGLVGFGKIPRYVTIRAQSFGMKVSAYDPYISKELAEKYKVELLSLNEILEQSDIISSHLPFNSETIEFFNKEKFNKMKKQPLFINTSRGKVVNEKDLIEACRNNTISAAALDVIEREPPDFSSEIFKLKNIIITPHAGFYSEQALEEVRKRSSLNITYFFQGEFDKVCLINKIK